MVLYEIFSCWLFLFEMAQSWCGKVILVTGAASGIGASIVKCLIKENVKHITILDIAEEAGIALEGELNAKYQENKVTFIKCDITDKERLLEAFSIVKDKCGYIDVVINNAGILDDTLESFEMEININLIATVRISLHAWNIMHKGKGGRNGTIINISSVVALTKCLRLPVYGATKNAILKFSTSLGDDVHYSKSGVRVLAVCFGGTDTPILKNSNKTFDKSAQEIKEDLRHLKIQSRDSAANAVIEVYKQGASGSVWISTSDKPAIDVTETYDKSIDLFHDCIYN